MCKSEFYKKQLIEKSSMLAHETVECDTPVADFEKEYTEQIEEGTYLTYLRCWIGYMIEQGSKKAVDAMKDLIQYRLSLRKEGSRR